MNWKPIETAPKDSTIVSLWVVDDLAKDQWCVFESFWYTNKNIWIDMLGKEVKGRITHWKIDDSEKPQVDYIV